MIGIVVGFNFSSGSRTHGVRQSFVVSHYHENRNGVDKMFGRMGGTTADAVGLWSAWRAGVKPWRLNAKYSTKLLGFAVAFNSSLGGAHAVL